MGLSGLTLQQVEVATLRAAERNPRTHSAKQIAQLVASIKQFGFVSPLLIDPGLQVIAGHGRLAAAKQAGLISVPCIVIEGLTDAQRRALLLADNRIAQSAGWDWEMLAAELPELKDFAEFDLGLTGFSEAELSRALGGHVAEPLLGSGLAFKIVVDCTGEQHQVELITRLEAEGLTCKPLMV